MKPLLCLLSLLGFGFCSLADDFTSFRVPAHKVQQIRLTFDLGLNRTRTGDYRPERNSEQLTENARGGSDYFWRSESDSRLIELFTAGEISEGLSSEKADAETSWDALRSHSTRKSYGFGTALYADAGTVWFPWSNWIGINVDGTASVDYEQSGSKSTSYAQIYGNMIGNIEDRWQDSKSESWDQNYQVGLSVGPSFGRVRNVTSVADALVMERRLIAEGVLSGEMQLSTRQALAEILYRKPSFRYVHDRWARFFWREVEETVQKDPAYARPLDAYVTQRIGENYFGSLLRRRGLEFLVNYQYTHRNEIRHDWDELSVRTDFDTMSVYEYSEDYSRVHSFDDYGLFSAQLRYYKPIGLKWQLGLRSKFDFNPFARAVIIGHYEKKYWIAELEPSLAWMIADRWFVSGRVLLTSLWEDYVGDDTYKRESVYSNSTIELGYQIEDNVRLSALLNDTYNWERERRTFNSIPEIGANDGRYTNFRVSLTYALNGALNQNNSPRF